MAPGVAASAAAIFAAYDSGAPSRLVTTSSIGCELPPEMSVAGTATTVAPGTAFCAWLWNCVDPVGRRIGALIVEVDVDLTDLRRCRYNRRKLAEYAPAVDASVSHVGRRVDDAFDGQQSARGSSQRRAGRIRDGHEESRPDRPAGCTRSRRDPAGSARRRSGTRRWKPATTMRPLRRPQLKMRPT